MVAVLFAETAVLCFIVVFTGVEAGLAVLIALGVIGDGVEAVSVDMTRSFFNAFDDASAFAVLSDSQVVAELDL